MRQPGKQAFSPVFGANQAVAWSTVVIFETIGAALRQSCLIKDEFE